MSYLEKQIDVQSNSPELTAMTNRLTELLIEVEKLFVEINDFKLIVKIDIK